VGEARHLAHMARLMACRLQDKSTKLVLRAWTLD